MVLIIIPAYNEEKEIGRTICGLFQHGYDQVVVVDDGSTDATTKAAKQAGAKVLCHRVNRGQGAALQTGDEYARSIGAATTVHFDADGQFDPIDIGPALALIDAGMADIVLGSRFLDQRSRIPFFKKYFILPVARVIGYLFTGVKLSDAHNGFRVLGPRALAVVDITQDGMAHNTEIICQIKKNNLRWREVPVAVKYREFGQGIGGGIKIITDLLISLFIK